MRSGLFSAALRRGARGDRGRDRGAALQRGGGVDASTVHSIEGDAIGAFQRRGLIEATGRGAFIQLYAVYQKR